MTDEVYNNLYEDFNSKNMDAEKLTISQLEQYLSKAA